MARVSSKICLVLLVALSIVYETHATFSLPDYLKNFPKQGKDFEPFANKGMMEFMNDLEGMCPKNEEFKDFFTKLKDYMACFSEGKDIQTELTVKSEKLFESLSALDGRQGGVSANSWRMIDGLLSMGKHLVEMKKSGSKEITFEDRRLLINSWVKWSRGIGLFVKTASEHKGKSIDLSTFGIDYAETGSSPPSQRILYESHGTFSLPNYLKNFPKMSKDFEHFAYEGMLHFLMSLESKCPQTAEFKDLFAKLEDYMACFKSSSPKIILMTVESEKLFRVMSRLDNARSKTTAESWRLIDAVLSMGKLLFEVSMKESKEITFEQRREMIDSMVQWTRAIGLFVKKVAEHKEQTIDLSVYGIDYTPSSSSSSIPGGGGASGEL